MLRMVVQHGLYNAGCCDCDATISVFEQQRKIYVRTMNNISYRKKYWWKDITGMITITLCYCSLSVYYTKCML